MVVGNDIFLYGNGQKSKLPSITAHASFPMENGWTSKTDVHYCDDESLEFEDEKDGAPRVDPELALPKHRLHSSVVPAKEALHS